MNSEKGLSSKRAQEELNQATANAETKRVDFDESPSTINQGFTASEGFEIYNLPSMVNLYESGLRGSPRLKELAENFLE